MNPGKCLSTNKWEEDKGDAATDVSNIVSIDWS